MATDSDPRNAASVIPYVLTRHETRTGKFYMRRDPWIDMSDFGWGYRIDGSGGARVSPYFDKDDVDGLRAWCHKYVAAHPGNTNDPKEAESLAAA